MVHLPRASILEIAQQVATKPYESAERSSRSYS
jgi:hypothetical protein